MYRSVGADSSGISYRWATRGGNLPHADPKLARLGVRQTEREWAGYTSTQVTAEEEGLLEPLWGESMAAEAAAGAETAVVTAEDAAVMTSILEGGVITVGWGLLGAIAAVSFVAYEGYEMYKHSHHKSDTKPTEDACATPTESGHGSLSIASPPPRVGKRARFGPFLEMPAPKRLKGGEHPVASGDFAGLVSTFVNPVTSRIIGYKGIPRKRRRNTSLERWSPFWAQQQPIMAS